MGGVIVILFTLTLYLLPATPLGGLVCYWGRHRVAWDRYDALAMLSPWAAWLILVITPLALNNKSLTNAVFEPLLCGIGGALVPLPRLWQNGRRGRFIEVAMGLAWGMGVFLLVPSLPE